MQGAKGVSFVVRKSIIEKELPLGQGGFLVYELKLNYRSGHNDFLLKLFLTRYIIKLEKRNNFIRE